MAQSFPTSLDSSATAEDLNKVIGELRKNSFFQMFVKYVSCRVAQAKEGLNSMDPSGVPAEQFVADYATKRGRLLERQAMETIVKGELPK